MSKQKTNKTVFKRLKITSTGKLTRRHQFANGHLKTNKSKGALNRAKKSTGFFIGELRTLKKQLGI